ncbi:MAG TPA: hypothetical protein VGM79_31070 [Streptosporangiaceae bacterium]
MERTTAHDSPARPDPAAEKRESRALLAWMASEPAQMILLEGRQQESVTPAMQAELARVRAALQDRTADVDQSGLIRPMPADMHAYVARLEKSPQAQPYFAEGWRPALVDLPRVCAYQPSVFVDHARERVADTRIDDIRSLAELTLPLDAGAPVTFQYDRARQMFITSIANQNLQVVGAFGGIAPGMPPGTVHMGFQVRMITSFLQVGSMQGRYFLRDGYHRGLGLVQCGARYVPALVLEDMLMADLVAPGSLSVESILDPKPPTLSDYWDDAVSVTARLPAPRRIISVAASELSVYG